MDHNVNAAAQHFDAEDAAHEHACYRAAHANGLTPAQADECDDGDKGCPECPFKRPHGVGGTSDLPEDGFIWMRHASRFDGRPLPVWIYVHRGVRYYIPFDDTAVDFEWEERDAEWQIVAAPTAAVHGMSVADSVLAEVLKWALAGHITEAGITVEAGRAIRAAACGVTEVPRG